MTKENFIIHACEQVLRFTQVEKWDDLSEELKVQLGFNMGAVALGLNLSKEDGFLALHSAHQEHMSMADFRKHLKLVITSHGMLVSGENIARTF